MKKSILSILICALFCTVFFVGCADNQDANLSSSQVASQEETSSKINEGEDEKEISSKSETNSIEETQTSSISSTTSSDTSSIKRPTHGNENAGSSTTSEGVKVYKNPGNVGMMSYSLNMNTTTALGKEYANREYYFETIVKEGYFNQYLVNCNDELLAHARIVAKYGGSLWVMAASSKKGLESFMQRFDTQMQKLEEAGLKDVINGFFWDEPTLGNRISPEEFGTITKTLYQKYGLRNFPVFGTAEFTKVESNTSVSSASKKQTTLTTESLKYVTDMGFDSYSIDVREGASNGGERQFAKWQKNCSEDIVDGQSFYTEHRKLLQKIANKPVNYWHWPSAWYDYLWGGLNGLKYADEGFWTAHLNFMARDVLEQDNPGGLCIYTFRRVDKDNNVAFERRMDLKDEETGEHLVYPDVEKYYIYSERLRFWKDYFDKQIPNLVR